MKCNGFLEVVTRAWSITISGYPLYRLICKLKSVKGALKTWSKEDLYNPQQKIARIKHQLADIHNKLNQDPMNVLIHEEEALNQQLNHWLTLEESQMRQKCRVDWLSLGDRNTKFF